MENSHADRRASQIVDPFVAEDLRQMALAPRYNAWIYSLIGPHLGTRILEVGSGIGNMTVWMLEHAEMLIGVEPNEHCWSTLQHRFLDKPNFHLLRSTLERLDDAEMRLGRLDTIVCTNVLEHIRDDAEQLRRMRSWLVPGGRIVVVAPAGPQAAGRIDRALGHYRRYTLASMRQAMTAADFRVDLLEYSNLLGLIGWWFNARIRRVVKQSDSQIRVFDRLSPLLAAVEKRVKLPAGLSILAVGTAA